MGRRLNVALLATIVVAAMLRWSSAQTAHVVGDSLGWVIPPGGAAAYTTWAANKTIRVGDRVVFNFNNGAHDVAKVTKANFDACNATNSILLLSNSPANFVLNETGEHYFLCAFPGHCSAGQKLAVKVSAATSSPAPQPSSPPPQSSSPPPQPSSPAPQPSTAPASPPQVASPSPAPVPSSPKASPSAAPVPSSPTASPPSSTSPPPSPSPPTATPPSSTISPTSPSGGDNVATPPAPGNSATSLGVTAGFSVTLLSLVVAFVM